MSLTESDIGVAEGAAMLSLTIHNLGDTTIFRCAGRIMFPYADALRTAVLAHPCIRVAVLDLAEIRAVDAAGLGILVSLRMWAKKTHTTLKLINLPPAVENLLELTNLSSVFEICSIQDMLELLCLAFKESQSVGTALAIEIPNQIRDNAEPATMQGQR